MLQELSMVEQRYQAVREVLDGAVIGEVAVRYGSTAGPCIAGSFAMPAVAWAPWPTVAASPTGVRIRSQPRSRHGSCRCVAATRGWGPRTILNRLRRELEAPPSRSVIYRCLVRHRLIEPKRRRRRRRREAHRRWERSRAMELWQMDVMAEVFLSDGTEVKIVSGIDDHSRFCVCASVVVRATARPVCDALVQALKQHGIPDQILTDNGKVFTGKLGRKPAIVAFDRICHENGIRHILTAPYSPTTTGKVERLHKTIRKEFLAEASFDTLEQMQAALDGWVIGYNTDRDNQAIGDVLPIRRFELARPSMLDVVDGQLQTATEPEPKKFVTRRVDDKGRILILNNRYHVGRYLTGQSVTVTVEAGLLNVAHNGVVVATHARRHKQEDDERMDRRSRATKPTRPTRGNEVFRRVDPTFGALSFAGTSYRVGNRYCGMLAGVRLVGDTVQITIDGQLVRTHKARHDKSKEYGALAQPNGKPRRDSSVA